MARRRLLDRIADARRPRELAWSVGAGEIGAYSSLGHDDSRFSPEEYGDYVATSSEVYSAAMLRARLRSSLRLRLYRGDGPEREEVTSGPAWDLLRRPNPHWTWARMERMNELSMCLWGEAPMAVHRTNGVPTELWWLKPSRLKPLVDKDKYIGGFTYESATGGSIQFAPDEIIWQRHPNPIDEFSPLSPLAAARLAADTARSMMMANRNLHSQGLQLGGLIVPATDKVTFSAEQARELEDLLHNRWSGEKNAKRWSVLRYEAQFKEMQVSPRDAEFVNGLSLTIRQVATAFGIPAPLLNDPTGATLSNVREYQKWMWEHALGPDAVMAAQEITHQLLPMFPARRGRGGQNPDTAEYDFSSVPALQESTSEAWARDAQAMDRGAITINEWRKRNGMPPVAWGDVFWGPVNKSPIDGPTAAEQPAPPTAPGVDGPQPSDSSGGVNEPALRLHPLRTTHDFLAAAGLNGGGPWS